jgi:hypothetical protein
MQIAGEDSPRTLRLGEVSESQVEVDQPMTGSVLDVAPEARMWGVMRQVPVARLELAGRVPRAESFPPPAEGELIEVADQDGVEPLVGEGRARFR